MKFLDANFLISLFVEDHAYNKRAIKIWEKIKQDELIISNSIIQEVITVLNTKIKVQKKILENAYANLNDGKIKIIDDTGLYDETMERILKYYPERLTFFDCLYMELMDQMGIYEIVTFDEHFNLNKDIKIIH